MIGSAAEGVLAFDAGYAAGTHPHLEDRRRDDLSGPGTGVWWSETATTTTVRVLEWAAMPLGPPPMGTLREVGELLSAPAVGQRLRELVRTTAARTGAGNPPLGDARAVGAGAILLAASVGGRIRPEPAAKLAAALPPPRLNDATDSGWADALARHAVVAAALSAPEHVTPGRDHGPQDRSRTLGMSLAALDPDQEAPAPDHPTPAVDHAPAAGHLTPAVEHGTPAPEHHAATRDNNRNGLAGAWLDASPLTAVLLAPNPSARRTALRTAVALAGRPHGPALLTHFLAGCHRDAAVLSWRGDVLMRLAADYPRQVLDVYLAARTQYGSEWDARTARAVRRLAETAHGGSTDAEAGHGWPTHAQAGHGGSTDAQAGHGGSTHAQAISVVHYWAGLAVRPVAEAVTRGRLPVDLRGWLALVRRHPAAGVSDL